MDSLALRTFPSPAIFVAVLTLTFWFLGIQNLQAADSSPMTGKELYQSHCAGCHGSDGTGAPSSSVGFKVPLPDFTDCDFASREAAGDWIIVAKKGGPARGFSKMMPAFGEALSDAQLSRTVDYIRRFCSNEAWPPGELNLPRPLSTTKAYPEDELVFETEVETEGLNRISNNLVYEQRFGERNQFELVLPLGWSEQEGQNGTNWVSAVGDIGLGFKRVMVHSLDSGSIVSLGGELLLPTGDDEEGFGSDTAVFEPYIVAGQILPSGFFLEFQGGFALPFDSDRQNEEGFWRAALGRMITTGEYGRRWTPMVEVTGSKEFASGTEVDWDVIPQLQVTLNHRQHVRLAAGARLPLNDTDERNPTYMAYLLWDWFDGGFFDGW